MCLLNMLIFVARCCKEEGFYIGEPSFLGANPDGIEKEQNFENHWNQIQWEQVLLYTTRIFISFEPRMCVLFTKCKALWLLLVLESAILLYGHQSWWWLKLSYVFDRMLWNDICFHSYKKFITNIHYHAYCISV